MALQDYSNYLQTKNNEILEKENAVDLFEVREEDFREDYTGCLSYEDINASKEFKYMEELLYEDGIIDTDYNFIEKRGNKKYLAIIIKFMVSERYFRESNYRHPQKFEFFHYRQYLEHRYAVNLTENMKKISDKDVKLHFLSKKWKYNLSRLVITDFFSLHTI